jgi:hypothetical protein
MPKWRPPPYTSPIGKGYLINAEIVRNALMHWRFEERYGSPSFRRAAARQAKLCEAMLAVVEVDRQPPGS